MHPPEPRAMSLDLGSQASTSRRHLATLDLFIVELVLRIIHAVMLELRRHGDDGNLRDPQLATREEEEEEEKDAKIKGGRWIFKLWLCWKGKGCEVWSSYSSVPERGSKVSNGSLLGRGPGGAGVDSPAVQP